MFSLEIKSLLEIIVKSKIMYRYTTMSHLKMEFFADLVWFLLMFITLDL